MHIFMAAAETWHDLMLTNEIPFRLYTYFHARKKNVGPMVGDIVRVKQANPHFRTFLDSGAFSMAATYNKNPQKAEDPYEYAWAYLDFVDRYGHAFDIVAELDIEHHLPDISGEQTLKWFMQLQEIVGKKALYCWHPHRGVEEWKEILANPTIQWVALANDTWRQYGKGKSMQMINQARRAGKLIHGFGQTRISTDMAYTKWHSADSSSWVQTERYGGVCVFKAGKLTVLSGAGSDRDKKRKTRELYRRHWNSIGLDAEKIIQEDPQEVRKAVLIAWKNLALWLYDRGKRRGEHLIWNQPPWNGQVPDPQHIYNETLRQAGYVTEEEIMGIDSERARQVDEIFEATESPRRTSKYAGDTPMKTKGKLKLGLPKRSAQSGEENTQDQVPRTRVTSETPLSSRLSNLQARMGAQGIQATEDAPIGTGGVPPKAKRREEWDTPTAGTPEQRQLQQLTQVFAPKTRLPLSTRALEKEIGESRPPQTTRITAPDGRVHVFDREGGYLGPLHGGPTTLGEIGAAYAIWENQKSGPGSETQGEDTERGDTHSRDRDSDTLRQTLSSPPSAGGNGHQHAFSAESAASGGRKLPPGARVHLPVVAEGGQNVSPPLVSAPLSGLGAPDSGDVSLPPVSRPLSSALVTVGSEEDPLRDEHGDFLPQVRAEAVHAAVSLLPGQACSTCSLSGDCPEFREDHLCAYEPLFSSLSTRDMTNIRPVMSALVDIDVRRTFMGVLQERLTAGGQLDPRVSAQLQGTMNRLQQLIGAVQAPPTTRLVVEERGGRMSASVEGPTRKAGGVLSRLFGAPQEAPVEADSLELNPDAGAIEGTVIEAQE